MKYYIIAGEASGDLHGANLLRAIRESDPAAEFRVWGGDQMEAAGATLVRHFRDLAFMGFLEVLLNIRTILRNIRFCKTDIEAYQPDALILIDYPGFNLRIAKWAAPKSFPVFYYIAPQIWAWNAKRAEGIRESVDRLFVILPFEKAFYKKYGMDVDFVGHPLLDITANFQKDARFREKHKLDKRPIIALLPGSRKQEISRLLPLMAEVAGAFPEYQFVIAGAPSTEESFYRSLLGNDQSIQLIHGDTYQLLAQASAALVTSGTATLETALFNVPQVVCYKGSPLSYLIARQLVRVKYISLVNLIADKKVVEELIQENCTVNRMREELLYILNQGKAADIRSGYAELRQLLGKPGASSRAGKLMVEGLVRCVKWR
ncbi:MAG: lipid-A-disaccharide synthase [Saprospiraceae bacterium]|nr:lipid-A-disaccharide synthase [Saprospiraceae bacterium]